MCPFNPIPPPLAAGHAPYGEIGDLRSCSLRQPYRVIPFGLARPPSAIPCPQEHRGRPPSSSRTLEQYHRIKKGWSEDRVRDLLGDPVREEDDRWFYGGVMPEPTTEICCEDGEVTLKKQYVDK